MPSQDQVDAAALQLAISARELLGLPVEAHEDGGFSSSAPTLPYHPPEVPASSITPLSFAQKLACPSPLLIRGALQDRKALQQWKEPGYLVAKMGNKKVKVSVTPDGRADDLKPLAGPGGQEKTVFALPAEAEMTFAELMSKVTTQSSQPSSSHDPSPVYYLQSQDSNLTDSSTGAGDLSPLLQDLLDSEGRSDISWASEAIGSKPEAVNVWLGGSKSQSSMHRDHYENLFFTVRGRKTFTVFPPFEAHFLCEDPRRPFDVHRHSADLPHNLSATPEEGTPATPWIPIDPTLPPDAARNRPNRRYAKGLKPLSIEVSEGEMLFLPAGWYHHVSQQADDRTERVCIAVNWWYESQAAFGPQWAMLDFIKAMGDGVHDDDDDDDGESR
ncbi:Clavaminate synthase-like protein [Jaminaea rosea]|uniref:Clavaminate synthase-like protein n=1 Tax=Jaminaea rosea TaxID=1569628 RepID=A0A316UW63_9BASI|nr:Clavaminate synthase-like protein [Jaminaea rosea]PWN29547.1 Clavaminate synthase-like protein [Jaminaea rosea]